ncbi:hypothetical protein BO71DRAFT_486844 [Aspergillus ellipticus CBS 707.79]|uniref:Uncharacterized protein n=1 Tax=Aspergillus ellipticus CBS 707.79 TaxID=1448320 RepID=A0A319D8C7_9EURO|nr:hypothetical protein BO71DRAFT_486844 [Aspergillus ellipticus CBS 707.79]
MSRALGVLIYTKSTGDVKLILQNAFLPVHRSVFLPPRSYCRRSAHRLHPSRLPQRFHLRHLRLTQAAASNTAAVDTYLTSHCGCKTISGNSAGVITGLGCGGPGPEVITEGVSGWAINSQFNPAACPPGSQTDKIADMDDRGSRGGLFCQG